MDEITHKCEKCNWNFNISIFGFVPPNYCPYCGNKWEIKKTPAQIIEEIKNLYRVYPISLGDEGKISILLNKLKEMIESNKL